jgi:hypothetical protein
MSRRKEKGALVAEGTAAPAQQSNVDVDTYLNQQRGLGEVQVGLPAIEGDRHGLQLLQVILKFLRDINVPVLSDVSGDSGTTCIRQTSVDSFRQLRTTSLIPLTHQPAQSDDKTRMQATEFTNKTHLRTEWAAASA